MSYHAKYNLKPMITHLGYPRFRTDQQAYQILAHYFAMWDDSEDIKETILPELEQIENGELKETEIDADVAGVAHINKDNTLLDMSSLGQPEMELPTEDFKGIVLEWVAFLEAHGY